MKQLFVGSSTLCPPPSSKTERLDAKSRTALVNFTRQKFPQYSHLMERAEFYRVAQQPDYVEFLDGERETLNLFMSLDTWNSLFPA